MAQRRTYRYERLNCLVGLIALAAGLIFVQPAHAQGQPAVTMIAQASFDGYYEPGFWIPIRVTLENSGPDVDGRIEVRVPRYGGNETTYSHRVGLPTTSRKEITLYVYPESYVGRLETRFVASDGATIAQVEISLNSISNNDRLFGVLSGTPSAFNMLADVDPIGGRASVAQLDIADLPARTQALDVLDVLAVSGIDTGALTDGQIAALTSWIVGGGRMIVAAGPGWQKTASGLQSLLPMSLDRTRTVPEVRALQDFAGAPSELAGSAVVSVGAMTHDAEVLAGQSDTPLVVRRRVGFGEVILLTVDPALAPLKGWDGAAALYRKLIDSTIERPGWAYGVQDWYSASAAASTLPNLELPPPSLLCGFLGLYIVAIGPMNYVFLRVVKRRELAWINIPVIVILFSIAAFVIGSRLRGNQPILSRLAVVQVWPEEDRAQTNGLVGIFSPNRALYQVAIGHGLLAHPVPGDSLFGSDRIDWTILDQADQMLVTDLQMDVAGFTLLSLEGQVAAPSLDYELSLTVGSLGAEVGGRVTNSSAITLHDAVILGPGERRALGDLRPGDTLPIALSLPAAQRASQPGQGSAYYYGGDSTVEDIVGSTSLYDTDAETRRRYNLLRAMINPYNTSGLASGSRGSGIYLAAWSEQSPLPAALDRTAYATSDTTLYLFALKPVVKTSQDRLTLTPGLFTWHPEPGSLSDASPYGTFLNQNSFSLRFNVAYPVPYSSIESLTLHLGSFGSTGLAEIGVSLWDFERAAWSEFPDAHWGDNDVPEPERYVGPGGEIRLMLDGTHNLATIRIEVADFTMVVKP